MQSTDSTIARLRLLSVLFDGMGDLILTLGKEEQSTGQAEFFKKFSSESSTMLSEFSEALTVGELGTLIKLLIKLNTHTNNLAKFMELTPEQKIVVGEDLKELAASAKALTAQIQKRSTPA